MKKLSFAIGIISLCFSAYTQDWSEIAVPANPGTGGIWELVDELSDDFNYEAPANDMGATFESKWKDGFINGWVGPGNTVWTPDNSSVTGGSLEIKATRKEGDIVYFQAVSSKAKVIFPVYVEVRMKIMNSVMANAVWMLSDDSAEEIDIVEGYGSSYSESADKTQDWFAKRMHLSHHVFDRTQDPILDYQPKDAGTWHNDGTYWRDNFRTIGVYWRDPFHLEYFIDGKLVRTVSGPEIIDPNEYRGGNGLSQEQSLIFSGAAQGWQVANGVWPTDNELAVEENNIFKIDWIRTYKRIGGGPVEPEEPPATSISKNKISDQVIFSNPVNDFVSVKTNTNVKQIDFYHLNGTLVKSSGNISVEGESVYVSDLPKGLYIMRVIDNSGNFASVKLLKQ